METRRVVKLYEPSPTPILYVRPVSNVLGLLPLMPMFLSGNSMQTIQHCLSNLQRSKFPYSCADVAKESGRKGSSGYEVNQWLWRFGRGKPRLGDLTPVCKCLRLRYSEWL